MLKSLAIVLSCFVAVGAASAQTAIGKSARVAVKPVPFNFAANLARGNQPQAALCDIYGGVWSVSGAGFSGGALTLSGSVTYPLAFGPAAGSLGIAPGLPLFLSTTFTETGYCSNYVEINARFNRTTRMWSGTLYETGSCTFESPVDIGMCP